MPFAFVLGAASAGVSAFVVFLLGRWALRRLIVDVPKQRSSHAKPTARSRGLAIGEITFAGFIAVAARDGGGPASAWSRFVGGALSIAAVSW